MTNKDKDLNSLGTARFRTMREMCGVDAQYLAKKFDFRVRTAQRWDKTHVAPEIVWEWLEKWWDTMCDHVADALDELEKNPPADKTEPIILMRYHTQQSLEDAGLDMPLPIHNALIGHLAMAFSVEGYGVDIKWVVIDD